MDNLANIQVTQCLKKAGLVAGTTTTVSFTANPLEYCIKGRMASKATVTNGATPTLDFNTGLAFVPVQPNFGTCYVFAYDIAGTLRVVQGSVVALDGAGNFAYAPQFPIVPDTTCAIGYVVTKVGATGSAWTFGASNLAGPPTGVTHTFVDVCMLLDRPQIS